LGFDNAQQHMRAQFVLSLRTGRRAWCSETGEALELTDYNVAEKAGKKKPRVTGDYQFLFLMSYFFCLFFCFLWAFRTLLRGLGASLRSRRGGCHGLDACASPVSLMTRPYYIPELAHCIYRARAKDLLAPHLSIALI